jgi:hypothetical protein
VTTVDIGHQDNRFAEACASMVAYDENARSPAASGGRVEGGPCGGRGHFGIDPSSVLPAVALACDDSRLPMAGAYARGVDSIELARCRSTVSPIRVGDVLRPVHLVAAGDSRLDAVDRPRACVAVPAPQTFDLGEVRGVRWPLLPARRDYR